MFAEQDKQKKANKEKLCEVFKSKYYELLLRLVIRI